MKAVVVSEPGGPEVLRLAEVPDPVPGPGEVVLDVVASAVNRADVLQRQGFYPPPPGAPEYPGLECSGTVSALGEGVEGWQIGDAACALLAGGGYAERVAVPAGQLLPIPGDIPIADAAALPEVTCTIWSTVFAAAGLRAGEVLLVHGGAGGIGTMAIQLAREAGATVAVTAGTPEKLARCRELGATVAVNYRDQDFVTEVRAATGGRGADVVLDNMGAKYLARNVDVLATGGRLVVIGLQGGVAAELNLGKLLTKRGTVLAASLRARPAGEKAEIVAGVREHVWPLVAAGRVVPVIHDRVPLAAVADAHRSMEASSHVGKLLLVVRPGA